MKLCYIILKPFLGKKHLVKFWEKVYIAALLGIGCGEASEDDKTASGENTCFKYLKKNFIQDNYLIFDVGANVGQYATEALNNFENNQVFVHSFEPSKKTYSKLVNNMKEFENIRLNNFGISNEISRAVLYSVEKNSGLSSLYKRDLSQFNLSLDNSETIELNTIDNYCSKNKIEEIDLLKMDIEGNEYKALLGAKKMLKNKRIKTIQIEFGGANIDARVFLKDFWNLLSVDYKMYRIMTNGLYELTDYKETMEIFYCTNYFFVKK